MVQTKPGQEKKAAVNIERQQHEFYLPICYDTTRKRQGPLFTGYIFVRVYELCWAFLHGTIGVRHVVTFGERPAIVGNGIIDGLKRQENSNGLILLTSPEPKQFKRGDKVKITVEPFEGVKAIYQGVAPHERVTVLMKMLNRQTRIVLPRSGVMAVA